MSGTSKIEFFIIFKPIWTDSQPMASRIWSFHEDFDVFQFCCTFWEALFQVGRHSCCSKAKTNFLAHLCSSRHRILTNLFSINIGFDQLFSTPSFYMAEPYMSIFRLCPPYRNLTSPVGPLISPTWIHVWSATEAFSMEKKLCPQSIQHYTESLRELGFLWSIQNWRRLIFWQEGQPERINLWYMKQCDK